MTPREQRSLPYWRASLVDRLRFLRTLDTSRGARGWLHHRRQILAISGVLGILHDLDPDATTHAEHILDEREQTRREFACETPSPDDGATE